MSSINQYIDLLNANRESIDSHSAGALNAARQSALEALAGQRMPVKGDEDYEVTDLEEVLPPTMVSTSTASRWPPTPPKRSIATCPI